MAHNVNPRVQGGKLIIEVDISRAAIQAAKPSSTGKTRLVGSTHGAMPVDCEHGTLSFALNVMAK